MYSIQDLRKKSRPELLKLISELKGKLLALRFESATGQLTEGHLIKATKQDIARIFTVLNEKADQNPSSNTQQVVEPKKSSSKVTLKKPKLDGKGN